MVKIIKQYYITEFADIVHKEIMHEPNITVQFCNIEDICIDPYCRKNIVIPNLFFPEFLQPCYATKYIDKVLSICPAQKEYFDNIGISNTSISYSFDPKNNKVVKISNAYKNRYKFYCGINFTDDFGIIEDLLQCFYDASCVSNILLLLSIDHENQSEVMNYILEVKRKIGINNLNDNIIPIINEVTSETDRKIFIDSCDCVLMINAMCMHPIDYYYGLYRNKRIISTINLDKNYIIDRVDSYNSIIRYNNKKNYYKHFDRLCLYNELSNTKLTKYNYNYNPPRKTGINKCI